MKEKISQSSLIMSLLWITFIFTGCENGTIRIPGTAANPDQIRQQIRDMNPRELDLCRVEIGPPRTFGSSVASNPSTGNTQSEANTWQNQVNAESKLFGDDNPPSSAAGPASANAAAAAPPNGGITSIVIIQRADLAYASIDVSPSSSKLATMATKGFARVTTQESVEENVEVNLVYNLSNTAGAWRCNTVNAMPVTTLKPLTTGRANPSDGRIGW